MLKRQKIRERREKQKNQTNKDQMQCLSSKHIGIGLGRKKKTGKKEGIKRRQKNREMKMEGKKCIKRLKHFGLRSRINMNSKIE